MAIDPDKIMSRTRTSLLLKEPFFGALSMRLDLVKDDSPFCPTMMTDGNEIRWNSKFVATLTDQERLGVLAHEVFHCALAHIYRRGGRDPMRWNFACDFAINPILLKAGFALPKGVLLDAKYEDMTAEQIYSLLPEQFSMSGGGKGSGKGQAGGQARPDAENGDYKNSPTGAFSDPPTTSKGKGNDSDDESDSGGSAGQGMTEDDWKIAAEQAAKIAQAAGRLPMGMDRLLSASRQPVVDWRSKLRPFVTQQIPHDYSFATPNRRYISRGLYLPGTVKENVGVIVFVLDCSGSVTDEMLQEGASEATGILNEAHPEKIVVIYHDASVQHVEEFTPDEGEVRFQAKGGGGTAFQPVLDYIQKEELNPLCCVWYTDLESYDSVQDPGYPTMWLTPEWVTRVAPYGETVRLTKTEK